MIITKREWQNIIDAVYDKFQFVADQIGKKEFVKDRVKMALEVGAKTYHEIYFIALNSPLLRPNKYAIQAVRDNMPTYLELVGNENLKPYHDEIIEMAVGYHEHILYPSISVGRKGTAKSNDPRYPEVNTWEGFSSELYHRIPLGYDWDAVAFFIITDSIEHGKALKIQAEFGDDALVYKSVLTNGCQECKSAYQKPDGTPKTIKVKELISNNILSIPQRIYDDQSSALPVSGVNHLYCTCMLYQYCGVEPWAK